MQESVSDASREALRLHRRPGRVFHSNSMLCVFPVRLSMKLNSIGSGHPILYLMKVGFGCVIYHLVFSVSTAKTPVAG